MIVMLGAAHAFALTSGEAQIRELSKKAMSAYILPGNATLLKIGYIGSSTQAAVNISADAFTTQAPLGTADLSFDMSAAAYDTLGELCDAIDADADYTCELTGGKRSDDSSLLIDVTASASTDAKASGGYSIEIDTGGSVSVDNTYVNRIGITPEAGKRVVLKYCNVQTDGVGSVNIYGKLARYEGSVDGVTRNDSTLVYSKATADDTEASHGNIYGVPWMEFAVGEHVVIDAGLAGTAQTATSHIQCFWDEK